MNMFGANTAAGDAINKLNQIHGIFVAASKGTLPGPLSDSDREFLGQMAGGINSSKTTGPQKWDNIQRGLARINQAIARERERIEELAGAYPKSESRATSPTTSPTPKKPANKAETPKKLKASDIEW